MKQLLFIMSLLAADAVAAQHQNHPSHNMVLLGENEIFASHIVYKKPHNYQVILSLNLDSDTKKAYLDSKNPSDIQILLLDPMDIKNIANMSQISGKLLSENSKGEQRVVLENVVISRKSFDVIFFNELPSDSESDLPFAPFVSEQRDSGYSCSRRPVLKCEPGETAYLCKNRNGKSIAKCK